MAFLNYSEQVEPKLTQGPKHVAILQGLIYVLRAALYI